MKPSKEVIRCLKLQYFGDFQYFILMSRILDCKPELYPAKKLRFFFWDHQLGFWRIEAEEFSVKKNKNWKSRQIAMATFFVNCVILNFAEFKWLLSMSIPPMTASISSVTDLLHMIESNEAEKWQEIKHLIYESYHEIKDSWLVQMLYDLHSQSGSSRCLELLLNVREPHEKFLLDKIAEGKDKGLPK